MSKSQTQRLEIFGTITLYPGDGFTTLEFTATDEELGFLRPKETLLKQALYALNQIPNHRLKGSTYRDSYELAAQIQQHLSQQKK